MSPQVIVWFSFGLAAFVIANLLMAIKARRFIAEDFGLSVFYFIAGPFGLVIIVSSILFLELKLADKIISFWHHLKMIIHISRRTINDVDLYDLWNNRR